MYYMGVCVCVCVCVCSAVPESDMTKHDIYIYIYEHRTLINKGHRFFSIFQNLFCAFMHLHLFLNIDMSIRLLPATINIILNKKSQNAIF